MNDPNSQRTERQNIQEQTNNNLQEIKLSIDALTSKVKPSAKEQHETHKWPRITAYAAIAYTGITAVILCVSACQTHLIKRSTIEANRAWLSAPNRFDFLKPIDDPEGPNFMGHYQNVGKSPALDVKDSMGWVAIPLSKPNIDPRAFPETPLWDGIDKTIRGVCFTSKPIDGGQAVFPSGTEESNLVSGVPAASARGDKEEINAGRQLIVITGCLTYRTFDEIHHTGFCRFVTKARTGQWEVLSCQVGNFAD
jgi:hypothetical protein